MCDHYTTICYSLCFILYYVIICYGMQCIGHCVVLYRMPHEIVQDIVGVLPHMFMRGMYRIYYIVSYMLCYMILIKHIIS